MSRACTFQMFCGLCFVSRFALRTCFRIVHNKCPNNFKQTLLFDLIHGFIVNSIAFTVHCLYLNGFQTRFGVMPRPLIFESINIKPVFFKVVSFSLYVYFMIKEYYYLIMVKIQKIFGFKNARDFELLITHFTKEYTNVQSYYMMLIMNSEIDLDNTQQPCLIS